MKGMHNVCYYYNTPNSDFKAVKRIKREGKETIQKLGKRV